MANATRHPCPPLRRSGSLGGDKGKQLLAQRMVVAGANVQDDRPGDVLNVGQVVRKGPTERQGGDGGFGEARGSAWNVMANKGMRTWIRNWSWISQGGGQVGNRRVKPSVLPADTVLADLRKRHAAASAISVAGANTARSTQRRGDPSILSSRSEVSRCCRSWSIRSSSCCAFAASGHGLDEVGVGTLGTG